MVYFIYIFLCTFSSSPFSSPLNIWILTVDRSTNDMLKRERYLEFRIKLRAVKLCFTLQRETCEASQTGPRVSFDTLKASPGTRDKKYKAKKTNIWKLITVGFVLNMEHCVKRWSLLLEIPTQNLCNPFKICRKMKQNKKNAKIVLLIRRSVIAYTFIYKNKVFMEFSWWPCQVLA